MIWFVLALILAISVGILAFPLLSKKSKKVSRTDGGIAVYKQQLDELTADVSRGILTEKDAEPVTLEIQRRLLKISKQKSTDVERGSGRLLAITTAVVIAVPLASIALYSNLGSPDLSSKPLASRNIEQEKTELAGKDLGNLVDRLAARLQEEPGNLDGWILLARTLSRMERYEEAANTYLNATALAAEDADLYVGAGENFYFQAEGVISPASLKAFKKAYEIDPEHPGARYYLALNDALSGNEEKALNSWISLYEESDPSAAFIRIVEGRIAEMGEKLGRNVSAILAAKKSSQPPQPGPSSEEVQAASNMSAADRQDMIRTMVARLASRMEDTPEFEGLMRLGQVYGTLGQFSKSAEAYGRASALQKSNPQPLTLQALAMIQQTDEGTPPSEAAIALYHRVLKLDAASVEALWYIGVSEARSGNKQAALQHWTKLQALAPEGSELKKNVTRAINALSEIKQN